MSLRQSQSPSLTPSPSRRTWLRMCVLGVSGFSAGIRAEQQLPPGVGVAASPPCDPATTPTPARPVAGYVRGGPAGDTAGGRRLRVTGTVAGVRCGLIAGAVVETWHDLGRGVTRTRQVTTAGGQYTLDTPMPVARGAEAARLNIRVEVPGKLVFTTCLFLPEAEAGARNRNDRLYDARLAMTLLDRSPAAVRASFNVILDL